MLNLNILLSKAFQCSLALLLLISCFAIQTPAFAEDKQKIAEDYRALGYEEQQKGNFNEALSHYTKAVSLGMENAVLFNDMGVLYEDIDLHGRAEQYYLRSIEVNRGYLPPYNNLAYLYKRLGRRDKAAWYFRMRYELGDPMDPWAQKAKDELLEIQPGYREWILAEEAEALNRQLEAESRRDFYQKVKRGQQHFRNGNTLFEEEDYEGALREYDQALALVPKNPRVIEARKETILEISKKQVRDQAEQAIKRLEIGDTLSARHEIQQMLTTIPKEPILISPQYAR